MIKRIIIAAVGFGISTAAFATGIPSTGDRDVIGTESTRSSTDERPRLTGERSATSAGGGSTERYMNKQDSEPRNSSAGSYMNRQDSPNVAPYRTRK